MTYGYRHSKVDRSFVKSVYSTIDRRAIFIERGQNVLYTSQNIEFLNPGIHGIIIMTQYYLWHVESLIYLILF